jgi:hypothetical protein
LLDVGRPEAAFQIAADPNMSISSSLLVRLLQEILNSDPERFRSGLLDAYSMARIFNQLYERNELSIEEISQLEWPFVMVLDHARPYMKTPLALHRVLQKDPRFFVQLLTFMYKRDAGLAVAETDAISKEKKEVRGRVAYEVLNSWRLLPGLKEDGTIDERELFEWIDAAKKQCEENGYKIAFGIQVGFLISCAPIGSDGVWPISTVRNLIEYLDDDLINRHIEIGIFNSRGVVTRGPGGGNQERELVAKYSKMADTVKIKWPVTAKVLRMIADNYLDSAKREDVFFEQRDMS